MLFGVRHKTGLVTEADWAEIETQGGRVVPRRGDRVFWVDGPENFLELMASSKVWIEVVSLS